MLKFRLYNAADNEFLFEDFAVTSDNKVILYDKRTGGWDREVEIGADWKVDSFSGKKDRKGVDIYENDIILWMVKAYMSCEEVDRWAENGKPEIKRRKWFKLIKGSGSFYDHLGGSIPEEGEKVGNIYQNKELLND